MSLSIEYFTELPLTKDHFGENVVIPLTISPNRNAISIYFFSMQKKISQILLSTL